MQAGIPRGLGKNVAHETARLFIQVWSQHKAELPVDEVGRRRIDEQFQIVPLFKEHFAIEKPSEKKC